MDWYGTEFYGIAPYLDFDASPFDAVPVGYGALRLTWTPPTGDWDLLRVVRNSYGPPDFPGDGFQIEDIPETAVNTREYLDTGLREGNFYYYAIFVRESTTQRWARAGVTIGLVTENYGYGDRMFRWIPGWFQEQDNARPRAPFFEGPLRRYLGVTGLAADFMRTELESLRWLRRPERISGNLLRVMAQQYGVPHEPSIGMRRTRFWLRDASFLYSRKGTLPGISDIITTITGWDNEISYGPNILRGIEAGAWFPNVDTTLTNLLEESDLNTGDIVVDVALVGAEWEISSAPLDGSGVCYHGVGVSPSTAYYVRAEVSSAVAANVVVEIEWYDEDQTSLRVDTAAAAPVAGDSEWHDVSLPEASPAGAAFAVIRFRGDQSVKFARAQFEEGSETPWTAPQMLVVNLFSSRTNHVTNPSFELGVATWNTDGGSTARSEVTSLFGEASLRVLDIGTPLPGPPGSGFDGGDAGGSGSTTLDGGSADSVSGDSVDGGDAQSSGGTTGGTVGTLTGGPYPIEVPGVQHAVQLHTTNVNARARVRWFDTGMTQVQASDWRTTSGEVPGSISWYQITFSSFAPENATFVSIDIEVEQDDFIDAVILEAADNPGGYFDGDQFGADFLWSADPHSSSSRFYPQRAARNSRLVALLPDYIPVNQIVQLRYVVPEFEFGGLTTTPGTMGTDTMGIVTLGTSP